MVAEGYYGQTKAGTGAAVRGGADAPGSQGLQGSGTAGTSAGMKPSQTSPGKTPAAGGGGMTATGPGTTPEAGSGERMASAGTSSMGPDTTPPDAGTVDAAMTAQAGTGSMEMTPATPCDLTGHWLNTVHYVTDALGQLQYAHVYIYYEITQQGDSFMVTRALHCGDDAVGGGSLAATVDFSKTWAACMTHVSYMGRKGTSVVSGDSCQIDLEKWYVVRGATLPYYLDPANELPSSEQMASGTTPGWEDWDGDGNPGITGGISGAVTGKIFVAPRAWTQYSGMVSQADVTSMFKLSLMWDQQQNVMGYDGSPFLGTEAARAADAKLHFGQFARLTAEQASGDDAAICARMVQLAPMLTPEAAGM